MHSRVNKDTGLARFPLEDDVTTARAQKQPATPSEEPTASTSTEKSEDMATETPLEGSAVLAIPSDEQEVIKSFWASSEGMEEEKELPTVEITLPEPREGGEGSSGDTTSTPEMESTATGEELTSEAAPVESTVPNPPTEAPMEEAQPAEEATEGTPAAAPVDAEAAETPTAEAPTAETEATPIPEPDPTPEAQPEQLPPKPRREVVFRQMCATCERLERKGCYAMYCQACGDYFAKMYEDEVENEELRSKVTEAGRPACNPSGDDSAYCKQCLLDWFDNALTWPHREPLPKYDRLSMLPIVEPFVSAGYMARLKDIQTYWEDKEKLFCPVPTCSAYVPRTSYTVAREVEVSKQVPKPKEEKAETPETQPETAAAEGVAEAAPAEAAPAEAVAEAAPTTVEAPTEAATTEAATTEATTTEATATEVATAEVAATEAAAVETPVADEIPSESTVITGAAAPETTTTTEATEATASEAPVVTPAAEDVNTEATPAEATVIETTVTEAGPPEAVPTETAPIETAPAEAATIEAATTETPAAETLAVEAPAAEAPTVETPAAETPAAETPAEEAPTVEGTATEGAAAEGAADQAAEQIEETPAPEQTEETPAPEPEPEPEMETVIEIVQKDFKSQLVVCPDPACRTTICTLCKSHFHGTDTPCVSRTSFYKSFMLAKYANPVEKTEDGKKEGESTEEDDDGDDEYEEFPNRFRQCVNCHNLVARHTGCDHMTCACGYAFCFYCGGDYGRYHSCISVDEYKEGTSVGGIKITNEDGFLDEGADVVVDKTGVLPKEEEDAKVAELLELVEFFEGEETKRMWKVKSGFEEAASKNDLPFSEEELQRLGKPMKYWKGKY
ncbi:hypothetical protein Dda_2281 [Drechslerella dactyloides]|uniref:IBR domain-containing protein n=1 Tax=Drechslerella dactyloides TaxID=74499 RepID=A0AAD6NLB7_DREDA|nr:hypothetical protein Dda_2281 [Drechslerella dactyloides]